MESEKTSEHKHNHYALCNPRHTNLSSLDCSMSNLNMATKFPPSWFSLSRRWRSVSSSELVSSISRFKDSTFFSSCGKYSDNITKSILLPELQTSPNDLTLHCFNLLLRFISSVCKWVPRDVFSYIYIYIKYIYMCVYIYISLPWPFGFCCQTNQSYFVRHCLKSKPTK